ncbi:MAG: MurR/RpiR family transcriptional regulator [Acidovorax sp.]|uniref:MurR/RpiR family transcriptional regulator n=1 Tax=Acidovorax sp. TaxID=1872122 RepID=UPI0039E6732A
MPLRPAESFLRRVRGQLEALSAAERKLADLLLDFPGELASYNASELAALAGVSNATVTRLIQRLGYSHYEDARRQAREERQSGSPLFQGATSAAPATGPLAAHLQQSRRNLEQTFGELTEAQLAAIVQALIDAPQVLIFGSRSSHAFAAYLRWQIIQVRPRVLALPGPGETLGEYLAQLAPQDCVVVFGVRRQTGQMDALLQAALRARARVLYIGDHASPGCAAATWSVQCHCAGPGPLDNHVAVMALCDLLATQVVTAAGPAARKRLAAIEVLHDELGEL